MPRYAASYRRTSISSSTGAVSENSIVFSPSGGHSHDGQSSSLIDTTKYSIWDFPVNTVYSTTPRAARQAAHIEQFKNFVVNLVNTSVLEPAGVVLGDNVINANNIVAGSISSDLIAANTIVANNIAANTITTDLLAADAIQSDNYSYTSGNFSTAGTFFNLTNGQIVSEQFAIDSSGNAYFAGDISAASGTFTGDLSGADISGGTITIGSGNTIFKVASDGDMWLGHATQSSAPFQVTKAGALTASSATVTGTINATAGYIGSATTGFDISSNSIISQDFVAGGENSGRGKLSLYSYGDIVIDSSPTSGNHSGQTYKTSIVGEYLYIEKTSSGDKPKVLIGNTSGNTDDATVGIYKNNSTKASMYMSSSAGNLVLYDSAGSLRINLVGSTGVLAGRTFQAYNSSGGMTAELKGSDGSIRAGNINGGYNNSSTNASGQFTVSHGLNGTPDFVVITPAQHKSGTPDWNVQYVVEPSSIGPSTFTVTVYEGLNDTVANDSQACYWFAGFSVHQ